jgi:hypothetical protein
LLKESGAPLQGKLRAPLQQMLLQAANAASSA